MLGTGGRGHGHGVANRRQRLRGWSVPEAVVTHIATILRRTLQCVSSLGCSPPYQCHLLCPILSPPVVPGASEGQATPLPTPELAVVWAARPLPELAGA